MECRCCIPTFDNPTIATSFTSSQILYAPGDYSISIRILQDLPLVDEQYYSSRAARTLALTSSISSALSGGNGRFKPISSTIGSSTPDTLTTKFPLPGFSALISTLALDPTAF